jgi:hypothetical protein
MPIADLRTFGMAAIGNGQSAIGNFFEDLKWLQG